MNVFKERCIELRKQDFTLLEIMEKTGRPKASVYFHIKDTPLSEEKKLSIQRAARLRARCAAEMRKGKSQRSFRLIKKWNTNNVLLLGHLLFDGGISNRSVVYQNRSKNLVERVSQLMRCIYDYEPRTSVDTVSGVHRISYHNVALAAHLKVIGHKLLDEVLFLSHEHQCVFLRAFFDDEGCMDFRPQKRVRQVRGYQKDKKILKLVIALLQTFDIEAMQKGNNEVVISGKKNLQIFQEHINFSPGVCVNGSRKNSLWKKDYEKRNILAAAIRSFKSS